MPDNAWDLGGGGDNFAFDHVGDEVEGFVIDMDTRQGTHIQTGEPEWWDKEQTRPKLITLLTLQTNLRENPKDTGLRTVTLAGSKKANPDGTKSRMCAARDAVLAVTGSTAFERGAWFKMRFAGEGAKTKPNFNPPKGFEAWYRSPALDLDGQDRTPPVNQISQSTQAGANWPAPTQADGPSWAQGGQQVNTTTGEMRQAPAANVTTGPLTMAQVQSVIELNVDPAQVYGADYKSRIQG